MPTIDITATLARRCDDPPRRRTRIADGPPDGGLTMVQAATELAATAAALSDGRGLTTGRLRDLDRLHERRTLR